ncbi:hypothetical protein DMC16_12795 [Lacticaseibacillus paracasei]|uniref:hypothetical protein n=1 Tax=Lacticaseibacillus paracasei TaxID=1597 RepID=UPI000D768434|nr:hypothetical protein [Lacticaseibacillus paracasei]AWR91932.1 hypothetical protein DMC16_12795 [Lacticaseibacillus paracasei]
MSDQSHSEQLNLNLEPSTNMSLLSIPASTHYWLIRARGGKYLSNFIEEGFISLGFNEVTMATLRSQNVVKETTGAPDIRQLVAKVRPNDSKLATTLHANQIRRFVYDFNEGDIVVVPGRNSERFAIGVITGEVYDEPIKPLTKRINNQVANGINYQLTNDIKRRPVSWIKTITRKELPKNLLFALNAQQTILKIEDGHSAINKLISPLFQDENGINLVIATQANKGLTVKQLQALAEIVSSAVPNGETTSLHIDTEKNSPITLTFIAQLFDQNTLHDIVGLIAPYIQPSTVVTTGGTLFTIHWVLKILGGKSIKEKGLLEWIQDRHSQYLDNKRKKYELKKLESPLKAPQPNKKAASISQAAQQGIASLNLELKNSGTEIEPHSQTNSDLVRSEPKKGKHNQKKKAKTKRPDHKDAPKDV